MKRMLFGIGILMTVFIFGFSEEPVDKISEVFEGVHTVIVDGIFCQIDISGNETVKTTLDGEIYASGFPFWGDNFHFQYEKRGSVLKVWLEGGSFFGFGIRYEGIIKMSVPKSTVVSAGNASGNITVSNIQSTEMKVETASGEIILDNLSGNITAKSASGDIITKSIHGNLETRVMSGDIKILDAEGTIDCSTASGSIVLKTISGALKGGTASGSILLKDFQGALDLRVISGDIQGYNVLLNADSTFHSTSGNIYVELANNPDNLAFNLHSISGEIAAAGSSAGRDLVFGRGSIRVDGSTVSGNQKYE